MLGGRSGDEGGELGWVDFRVKSFQVPVGPGADGAELAARWELSLSDEVVRWVLMGQPSGLKLMSGLDSSGK